ncbi:MAG: EF-P 5-aminopentanol modification-associated protein YfmH, partial [Neobacillus sp.]
EITMYEDNPDWRLYFGLIQNLYQNHPVKIDIAGTVESISHITKDWLYECYNTFYHPSNMLLFIVGPVDADAFMNQVRENQAKKEYKDMPDIKRKFVEEPAQAAEKKQVLEMNVQTSKCLVGIKALHIDQSGTEMLKNELVMNVFLDLLFGKSSENYNQLYNEGLIDETFSFDYTQEQGFGFAMIGGDTGDADKLADKLQKMLLDAKTGSPFSENQLERAIKKKIGAFLRAVNSPEYIANQFTRYAFNDMNLFDVVPTLEKITLEDVQSLAAEVISEERLSVCQVIPKKK